MPDRPIPDEAALLAVKLRLRRELLERRAVLPPELQRELSERIRLRLERHPLWRQCQAPCLFVGCKPGEVETDRLIEDALASGRKVFVPVVIPGSPLLATVEIDSLERLVPGPFGLRQPPAAGPVRAEPAWDLAVVPGVAFDRRGNRIGFGKGYYDRLLAAHPTPRIALAFGFQLLPGGLAPLPHDIPMDLIVTEHETIDTRPPRVG